MLDSYQQNKTCLTMPYYALLAHVYTCISIPLSLFITTTLRGKSHMDHPIYLTTNST